MATRREMSRGQDFPEPPTKSRSGCCVICGANLSEDRRPQLLPCLHTTCRDCLPVDDDSRACPVCGQQYDLQEVTASVLYKEYRPGRSANSKCGGCENSIVLGRCDDCDEDLCSDCVAAHKRVKVTRNHKIQIIGTGQTLFCSIHKKEPLVTYCVTCDLLTCQHCQIIHKNHKCLSSTEALEEQVMQLRRMAENAGQKGETVKQRLLGLSGRLSGLDILQRQMRKEVRSAAIAVCNVVVKRAAKIFRELEELFRKERERIAESQATLQRLAKKQEHVLMFTERALNTQDWTALLSCKRQIQTQLQHILDQVALPPAVMTEFSFECDESGVKEALSTFGKIVAKEVPFVCSEVSQREPNPFSQSQNISYLSRSPGKQTPISTSPKPQMFSPYALSTDPDSSRIRPYPPADISPVRQCSPSTKEDAPPNSVKFPVESSEPPAQDRVVLFPSPDNRLSKLPNLKRPWSYHPYRPKNAHCVNPDSVKHTLTSGQNPTQLIFSFLQAKQMTRCTSAAAHPAGSRYSTETLGTPARLINNHSDSVSMYGQLSQRHGSAQKVPQSGTQTAAGPGPTQTPKAGLSNPLTFRHKSLEELGLFGGSSYRYADNQHSEVDPMGTEQGPSLSSRIPPDSLCQWAPPGHIQRNDGSGSAVAKEMAPSTPTVLDKDTSTADGLPVGGTTGVSARPEMVTSPAVLFQKPGKPGYFFVNNGGSSANETAPTGVLFAVSVTGATTSVHFVPQGIQGQQHLTTDHTPTPTRQQTGTVPIHVVHGVTSDSAASQFQPTTAINGGVVTRRKTLLPLAQKPLLSLTGQSVENQPITDHRTDVKNCETRADTGTSPAVQASPLVRVEKENEEFGDANDSFCCPGEMDGEENKHIIVRDGDGVFILNMHGSEMKRRWLPDVSVYRLPITVDKSDRPLPCFRLLPRGQSKGYNLQVVPEAKQVSSSDSSPIICPSVCRPLKVKVMRCAACRTGGPLTTCSVCGRAFHQDCHIPPVRQSIPEQWQCTLCHSLSGVGDSNSVDTHGHPCLNALDQMRCEYLLLTLTCKRQSVVLYRPAKVSSPSSRYIDIVLVRGRLLRKLLPPYHSPIEFVEDVWLLLNTLLNCSEEAHLVEQLQKVFSKKLVRVFGPNLPTSLLTNPYRERTE